MNQLTALYLTNYVMFFLLGGFPSHFFSVSALSGAITLKLATPGHASMLCRASL
ncbi:hypothetical protein ACRRTK_002690 [Alexandromys fortis]